MSKPNETPSTPTGDDRNLVAGSESAAAPELEEVVQQFWEKNRSLLIGLAVVILLAILIRNGWAAYQAGQIESAREEYAAASTDAELKAFADDRAGTALAGVALLQVADKAFSEARYAEALTGYQAAAEELEDSIFADRVALGAAMSQLMNGNTAEGLSALRTLANDTDAASAVRAEAIYHLASIALKDGDAAEVGALATQVDTVNPGSSWAQRVELMRATMGTDAPAAETAASSEISFESP